MGEVRELKIVYRGTCQWCFKPYDSPDPAEPWQSTECPHCRKMNTFIPDDAELWQCGCGSTAFSLYRNGIAVCLECGTFNHTIRFEPDL